MLPRYPQLYPNFLGYLAGNRRTSSEARADNIAHSIRVYKTFSEVHGRSNGADSRNRTRDHPITNRELYQLSYVGFDLRKIELGQWRFLIGFSSGFGHKYL